MDTVGHFQQIAADTPVWFHYLLGTVLFVSGIISIASNGITLFIFFVKDRTLLTRTNIYIATVCALSFIMSTFGLPLVVASFYNREWMFGFLGCQYYAFLMTFGGLTTMLLLCMISVDHYIYVVRNDLLNHLSSISSLAAVVACCLLGLSFAFGPLLGWNQYILEGVGTNCAIDLVSNYNNGRSYVISLLIVFFAVPVSIMIWAYASVYTKVVREYRERTQSANISDEHEREMMRKLSIEKELIVTITIIIGSFMFCYTPYSVLLLVEVLVSDVTWSPQVLVLPSILVKVGGVFTPFVYIGRNKRFRNHLSKLFPCCRSIRILPETTAQVSYNQTSIKTLHLLAKTPVRSKPSINRKTKASRTVLNAKRPSKLSVSSF